MNTTNWRGSAWLLAVFLVGCGSSQPPAEGVGSGGPGPANPIDGTPPPADVASLAGCLLDAEPAQCATAVASLGNLAACPPNEDEGLNCIFNTAYDAIGVGRLGEAAQLALDACDDSPAAPLCSLLSSLGPVPDALPLVTDVVLRGDLVIEDEHLEAGASDAWVGEASRIGGTAHYHRGEHIYNDYVFDAWGADDGDDARRLAVSLLLGRAVERTERLDQLFQAVGSQFGLPRPIGAEEHYGDRFALDDGTDLLEVRWATRPNDLRLRARYVRLLEAANARLVVLADTRDEAGMFGLDIGIGTRRFDRAVLIDASGVRAIDLLDGREQLLSTSVDIDLDAMTLDVTLPRGLLSAANGRLRVAVASLGAIGSVEDDETPTLRIANLAYRFDEPVAGLYNERGQALSLFAGNIDRYAAEIDLAAMDAGLTQTVRPGPGYHERQFDSGDNISDRASREDGPVQHYGLYVPPEFDPQQLTPLAIWLHYRGGKAHNGAAWTPRLIHSYGDRHGQIVVTPRGRGTSTWYVSRAHQDFFEVFDDIHGLFANIDPTRRYLSGYSMGGYGTYLFGLLYPDLFAAGYSTSGALTQGAWTGVGPSGPLCDMEEFTIPGLGDGNACFIEANNGDADAQLTWRLLENARHLPLAIHHGTTDYLVPITGLLRVGERLTGLGYRHDLLTFIGYEHFTQAIIDEWRDGADYMAQFRAVENPRRITYRISPALLRAINTVNDNGVSFNFNPDGAWWVSGMRLRDDNADDTENFGRIDAESEALPARNVLPLPRTGLDQGSTPILAPLGHSTPFVRTGLDWLQLGEQATANRFRASVENLSEATLALDRMALDFGQRIDGQLDSDGPVTLRLTGISQAMTLCQNGQARSVNGSAVIELPAGTSNLSLLPDAGCG
jgi:hypothetical protein